MFKGVPGIMARRRGVVLTAANASAAVAAQLWAAWAPWWGQSTDGHGDVHGDGSGRAGMLVEKSPSNAQRLPFLEACFDGRAQMRAVVMLKSPVLNGQVGKSHTTDLAKLSKAVGCFHARLPAATQPSPLELTRKDSTAAAPPLRLSPVYCPSPPLADALRHPERGQLLALLGGRPRRPRPRPRQPARRPQGSRRPRTVGTFF